MSKKLTAKNDKKEAANAPDEHIDRNVLE